MIDNEQDDDAADAEQDQGWFRKNFVTTLLVLVAAHQFYHVHTGGLSSWRGGGFGMYGSFHPTHRDLWVVDTTTGESVRYTKADGDATEDSRRPSLRPFLTWTNEAAMRRYHETLTPAERARTELQVWELQFDPSTSELSGELLVKIEAQKEE